MTEEALLEKLDKLISVLERMAPPERSEFDLNLGECFIWQPEKLRLKPVTHINRVDLTLIRGVDNVRNQLFNNTERFANGYPANNVLLWGARGMGKSSLVKAIHHTINLNKAPDQTLKLIEIYREDISTLPILMDGLKGSNYRIILFCDDLSFDQDDTSYKSLKAALDGGIEGRPNNMLFYATSNRRHLIPRDMIDNEQSTAINPTEAIEEKVSLSDRFGLWLGFHKCSQDEYLEMINSYAAYFNLNQDFDMLHADALEWATTRGNRSGRVAWQFIQDLAGRLGCKLSSFD